MTPEDRMRLTRILFSGKAIIYITVTLMQD